MTLTKILSMSSARSGLALTKDGSLLMVTCPAATMDEFAQGLLSQRQHDFEICVERAGAVDSGRLLQIVGERVEELLHDEYCASVHHRGDDVAGPGVDQRVDAE